MPICFSIRRSLAASVTGLALAALLTVPARAGGPLGYHFTDITKAALSGVSSRSVGITNTGVVAGVYDINGPGVPPFFGYLYDTNTGSATSVNYHPEGGGPEFDSISSSGNLVLGDYATPAGDIHYFTYSSGQATDLPDPAGISNNYLHFGPNYSYYTGLNNSGALTGYFSADSGVSEQSFLSQNGVQTTFSVPGASFTDALGINASGTIVGTSYSDTFQADGFLRSADGSFTLFDVPGAVNTYLQGASDNGNLFGFFQGSDGNYENFVDFGGTFIEGIDFPGSVFTDLTGINDSGEISGYYVEPDNTHVSFYATLVPVPEASSLMGMGFGLPLLVLLGLRRRLMH